MMDAIAWLERTALSTFMREDFYAYFVALILHAWGMAMLVGGGLAVGLRLLGIASGAQLGAFARLFPFMRIGAVLAAFSGLALLAGYPAKALTNWVFALKFVLLAFAAVCLWLASRRAFAHAAGGRAIDPAARALAALSIALWLGAVAAGKLLLYTYSILMTADLP